MSLFVLDVHRRWLSSMSTTTDDGSHRCRQRPTMALSDLEVRHQWLPSTSTAIDDGSSFSTFVDDGSSISTTNDDGSLRCQQRRTMAFLDLDVHRRWLSSTTTFFNAGSPRQRRTTDDGSPRQRRTTDDGSPRQQPTNDDGSPRQRRTTDDGSSYSTFIDDGSLQRRQRLTNVPGDFDRHCYSSLSTEWQ
jgi:hypothetical protein